MLAIGLFGVPLGVAVLLYAAQVERTELERVADARRAGARNDGGG